MTIWHCVCNLVNPKFKISQKIDTLLWSNFSFRKIWNILWSALTRDKSLSTRFIWLIIVISASGFAGYFLSETLAGYNTKFISTTIETRNQKYILKLSLETVQWLYHRVWRMEATLLKKVDKQCEWSVFWSDIASH